ncbi:MAG: hypothetical protein ACRD22_02755 [Terriglobia bacterium]
MNMFIPQQGFDASNPPVSVPSGKSWVAGYIGGDTPHVWTSGEWSRFRRIAKLPVYVCSDPGQANPTNDAFAALRSLYDLGVPKGKTLALDLETAVSPSYVKRFYRVIRWGGYWLWIYGSADFVFANPVCSGYWVADFNGVSNRLYPHKGVVASQYASGSVYDSDVTTWWQRTHRLWR